MNNDTGIYNNTSGADADLQSFTLNEGLRVCDVISSDVISIPLRREIIEHNCEEAKISTFSLKKPLKYLN